MKLQRLFLKFTPLFKSIVDACFFLIPNLYKLNLKDFLLYQQTIGQDYLVMSLLYAVLYLIGILTIVMLIFKNKNLD